jgi:hypothetical protein
MTKAALSNAVVIATVLSFGACGSESQEGGLPVPIDDLAGALADATCNNIGPCCQEAGIPHDRAECHAHAEAQFGGEIAEARSSPNVTYHADAARACVDAYTFVVKGCRDKNEVGAACKAIFVGTLQPGAACTMSSECVDGAGCEPGDDGVTMQCKASPFELRGKMGEACMATCSIQSDSLSCFGAGGGPGGTVDGGTGQALPSCYTNDGLYCNAMSTCTAAPAIGEACTSIAACAGDTFCDGGVCIAKRTTGSCGQRLDGCANSSHCDANFQCIPRQATGAACAKDFDCAATDDCKDGTCRRRTIARDTTCKGDF